MYVCIPSLNAPTNLIYEKIISKCKDKSRFIFFVRPYQYEEYCNAMKDVSIVCIDESCTNIGLTRKFIDNYMRGKVPYYMMMDDNICSLGYVIEGKAISVSKLGIDQDSVFDYIEKIVEYTINHYPKTCILTIRRSAFCHNVVKEKAVSLNSGALPIDVTVINTRYPLENIPETNVIVEDVNYGISSISKGLYIGTIHCIYNSASESHVSRCEPDKNKRLEDTIRISKILEERYNCGEWMKWFMSRNNEYLIAKVNWKKTGLEPIHISLDEILKALEEEELG